MFSIFFFLLILVCVTLRQTDLSFLTWIAYKSVFMGSTPHIPTPTNFPLSRVISLTCKSDPMISLLKLFNKVHCLSSEAQGPFCFTDSTWPRSKVPLGFHHFVMPLLTSDVLNFMFSEVVYLLSCSRFLSPISALQSFHVRFRRNASPSS